MNTKTYPQSKTVINLRDVVWDLLSQWKAVLITALVMMLLVSGAKYYKDLSSYKNASQQKDEISQSGLTADDRISDILAALPEDERATVEYMVNQNEWIETEKEYMNNSILMNTNPANQRTLILDYYISMSDTGDSKMTALVYGYAGYLNNEKLISSIGQIIDPDADSKYIAELIRVNGDNNGKGNSSGNGNSLVIDSDADGAVMEVCIVLPDDIDAAAVESAMTAGLTEYQTELKSKIGNHNISLIKSDEAYLYNSAALNNHNNIMSSIYNLQNFSKNMQTSLSDGQKAAIEAITAIKKDSSSAEAVETDAAKADQSVPGFSKKYALLGLVLGALIYAFVYLLLIMSKGRINYASDAEYYIPSRLLGEIYQKKEHKGLSVLLHSNIVDKYRYKGKSDADSQKNKAIDAITSVCEHTGAQTLTLFNMTGSESKELIEELTGRVSDAGLQLNSIDIAGDIDEKSLLSAVHALFAVSPATRAADTINLAVLCNDYDIDIVGSIYTSLV